MFELNEGSPIDMLRQFSVFLDADLIEDFGASKLVLNNQNGNGTVSLYEVFPGLTAWVYDVRFTNQVKFVTTFSKDRPYYFGYHISGYQLQKFPHEQEYKRIKQGQNFIIISEPNTSSEFIIPADVDYKCCYLILNPVLLRDSKSSMRQELRSNLKEIFSDLKEERPYRYFGEIDLRTGNHTEIIIKNKKTDVVGRLLTEGAIANMLACQITAHDLDQKTESFEPKLSDKELKKITELGDYIRENLSEKISVNSLSIHLGLTEKKLQKGVRFLYGQSVGRFVTNIRLEMAKELIHLTDMNISEICFNVGYQSRSHFSKLFNSRFGILPNDYKISLEKENIYFEISYRSTAYKNLRKKDIENIIQTSRIKNKKLKITGSLIYHENMFFQLIEGPKLHVLELYKKIKSDKRHNNVITMWEGTKPNLDFKLWDMAFISDDNILNISYQGTSEKLDLKHLMGDIKDQTIASQILWRKVKTIIKTESKVG